MGGNMKPQIPKKPLKTRSYGYVACAGSLPCHLPDRIYVGARVLLTSYDKTFPDY